MPHNEAAPDGASAIGRRKDDRDSYATSNASRSGMHCEEKCKNFHWHLSGSHFRDYHLLFDEHASQIFEGVDLLAERVRKIGGTTIRSIGHISQLQTIADDNEEMVAPGEMVRRLREDNTHLAQAQRTAHEVCERNRDVATASILEVMLDEAERRAWFLFEVTRGSDNTN